MLQYLVPEILKKAIRTKKRKITAAKNIPVAFDVSWYFENTRRASAIPIARINSCTIDIVSGPIEKLSPARSPFLIFFGNTAFMSLFFLRYKVYLIITKNIKFCKFDENKFIIVEKLFYFCSKIC